MTLTYGSLQLIYNYLAWFTKPEADSDNRLVKVLGFLTWQYWLIGLLAIIVFFVFEGSFRFIKKQDERIGGLEEQLQPRLKIEYQEGLQPYSFRQEGYWVFRIALRNTSAKSIHNVSVRVIGITPHPKSLLVFPLRLRATNHPKDSSIILNPNAPEYIDVVAYRSYNNNLTVTHIEEKAYARLDTPTGYGLTTHILTIQATGDSVPPTSRSFKVEFKHELESFNIRMTYLIEETEVSNYDSFQNVGSIPNS